MGTLEAQMDAKRLVEFGDERRGQLTQMAEDLPLFTASAPKPAAPSALEALLSALRPDELSPKEALEFLYKLKALIDKRG